MAPVDDKECSGVDIRSLWREYFNTTCKILITILNERRECLIKYSISTTPIEPR